MESSLPENFEVKPKNPTAEALEKWIQPGEGVKNPKLRRRHVAQRNIPRRGPVKLKFIESIQHSLKSKAANQFVIHAGMGEAQMADRSHFELAAVPSSNVDNTGQEEWLDPKGDAASAGNDDDAQSMVESPHVELPIEPSSNVDHRSSDRRNGWTQTFLLGDAASAGNDDDAQSMVESPHVELPIEPSSNVDPRTPDRGNGWTQKVSLEWVFVITNLILELSSAVLDQLSSKNLPGCALSALLISFAALLLCIVELIYRARKEKVHWMWRGMLPWLYYPSQNHKPFGSFKDIGLVCALCQCIVTAINYSQSDPIIKISAWPFVFAFGQLFHKF